MLREDQIVGSPDRPAQADRRLHRGDPRPARDVRQPVGPRPAQRPALPRARGAERRAGARQQAQVGVPGEHVARAADAAERRPRLLRGAAGADVRRDQRAPGGVPPRHPRVRPAPAGAAQRDPRPVEGRGRPDGAGVLVVRPAHRCSSWRRRCSASGPRLHGIDLRRRDRRRRGRGVLRRAPAQAGPAQPGHQRGQVHRRRRLRGGPRRARRAGDPDHGDRHRDRRARGRPGADLRVLPAGRPRQLARGGHGPRPHPVAPHRGAARRPHVARDRGRPGQHLRLLAARR